MPFGGLYRWAQCAQRDLLVVVEMGEDGLPGGLRVTLAEDRDQILVRVPAADVLIRVRVKQAEPDADVALGLEVPDAAGVFAGTTLAICPYSLDPAIRALTGAQPLRPASLPVVDPPGLPVRFADEDRPLVYVTLGTFSNNDLDLFRLILEALAREPVNVLATIGRNNDPLLLGPLADNARVVQFIPQAELLPHCAAVVHHAGAGTTFGVLAHGLPAVALPQSADNFIITQRLAAAGAAHTLMPGQVTGDAVRSGVRAVLEDAGYRHSARLLAEEIAGMPSPEQVAAGLSGSRRTG